MGSSRTLSAVLAATIVLGALPSPAYDYEFVVQNNLGKSTTLTGSFTTSAMTDLYVSVDGDDATGTGLSSAPFRTLTHAISLAAPDSKIHIAPGTYSAATGETFPLRPASAALVG